MSCCKKSMLVLISSVSIVSRAASDYKYIAIVVSFVKL